MAEERYEVDHQEMARYGGPMPMSGSGDGVVMVPARIVRENAGVDVLTEALKFGSKDILLDEDQRALVRTALADAPNAHDKAILSAVDALESGRQLIELRAVADKMASSHFALAPATRSGKLVTRIFDRVNGTIRFRARGWSHDLPVFGTPATTSVSPFNRYRRQTGMVPYIPPMCRVEPMANKLVLWDHAWNDTERPARARMHLDPALIEHVVGDLYVVLTTWDLTPLERAALGG